MGSREWGVGSGEWGVGSGRAPGGFRSSFAPRPVYLRLRDE